MDPGGSAQLRSFAGIHISPLALTTSLDSCHHHEAHSFRRDWGRRVTKAFTLLTALTLVFVYVAGSQILRSALADPDVTKITILSRRPLPSWLPVPSESKPTEVVVLSDFEKYPADVQKKLAEHDACIWALGCSSLCMSEQDYTRITYDYTVSAIQALRDGGIAGSQTASPFRFIFVSGEGADPEKKNLPMFGRIKVRSIAFRESHLSTDGRVLRALQKNS